MWCMQPPSRPSPTPTDPVDLTPGAVAPNQEASGDASAIAEPDPTAGYPKAPAAARIHAETIDGLVTGGPILIAGFLLGSMPAPRVLAPLRTILVVGCYVWAFYYFFLKDGLPGGQSIGKRRAGLMVVNLSTNQPCSRSRSAIRSERIRRFTQRALERPVRTSGRRTWLVILRAALFATRAPTPTRGLGAAL